jgi:hypothetical protein
LAILHFSQCIPPLPLFLCVSKAFAFAFENVRRKSDCFAALFATIFADAVNLEVMSGGVKMVFAADLFFQLVYLRGEKLD